MDGTRLTHDELIDLTRRQGHDILDTLGDLLRHGPAFILPPVRDQQLATPAY